MNILIYLISFILGFSITVTLIPKIMLVSVRKKMLDIPDNRKIHKHTSSRLGGVAFYPSLFITVCVAIIAFEALGMDPVSMNLYWLILSLGAVFLVYIVGISDDIKGISYKTKFMCQILASILIIASGTWINNLYGLFGVYMIPAWIGFPLTSLFIVFIMNAVNLIDGIDGLSSGLCIVALSFYGLIFFFHDQTLPALISFSTVGALLGFFRYNFFGFPNRSIKIFMGDTGTLFIGAIVGLLALKLLHFDSTSDDNKNYTEILIAYSVLIVPCFDVLRVMIHRYKNKNPIFSPDKSHIHHKLLALGFSTKQTLYVILSFSALITIVNLLLNKIIALEYVMIFDAILWTTLNIIITKKTNK